MVAEVKINPRIYGRLLAKTLPGIIETEDENERGRDKRGSWDTTGFSIPPRRVQESAQSRKHLECGIVSPPTAPGPHGRYRLRD
jgi:hypothetical protein